MNHYAGFRGAVVENISQFIIDSNAEEIAGYILRGGVIAPGVEVEQVCVGLSDHLACIGELGEHALDRRPSDVGRCLVSVCIESIERERYHLSWPNVLHGLQGGIWNVVNLREQGLGLGLVWFFFFRIESGKIKKKK